MVDEIQKIPSLLDEVHRLIETKRYRFALSGSSARKLKRGGANMLAGRALVYHLHPLTWTELNGGSTISNVLQYGTLPRIILEKDYSLRHERLRAYVGTYLSEEIKAEAVTRNLESFHRFLSVASLANGQVTNLSNISRDAGISRSTITSYFSILEDTLLGSFLPSWQPRMRMKEVNHPKFYLFDCGIFRALTDRVDEKPTPEERGVLLETLVFHELKARLDYGRGGGSLHYWRTHDGVEVDFVWKKGNKLVAIEVKAADVWKPGFGKGLLTFRENNKATTCVGVYLGTKKLAQKFGVVYPFEQFASHLRSGTLIK